METELTNIVKRPRLLQYNRRRNLNKINENLKCPSQFSDSANLFHDCNFTGFSNSTPYSLASQTSSIICSHEKIEIEFDIGSSPFYKISNSTESDDNEALKLDDINFHICNKPPKESKMTEQLLCMDDSLLENVDLCCQNTMANGKENKFDTQKLENCLEVKNKSYQSPDIFTSTDKQEDSADSEDQAWDMSISLQDDKNKSLNEENNSSICEKNVLSPGLSNIVLSTWDSPTSAKKSGSLEGFLKRTLSSNAHKTIVHHSPRLVSSLHNKRPCPYSDLYFGLPSNVKRLIKRFKGIDKLYGK